MRVGAGWALDTLDGWQRVSLALKLHRGLACHKSNLPSDLMT